jgi:nickel-type superoxide dismutase maturation protease
VVGHGTREGRGEVGGSSGREAGGSTYFRVAVSGDSMRPTLSEGDWLLCRRLGPAYRVRAGDVVVLERPDRPGLLIVKRAVRRDGDGWWLRGDNSGRSDDSLTFGAVPERQLIARVLARLRPRPRRM